MLFRVLRLFLFSALLAGGCAPRVAEAADRAAVPVCVARDDGSLTAAHVLAGALAMDCTGAQTRWRSGDFWAVGASLPADLPADQPLVVRIGSLWQAGLTLHVQYADGRIVSRRLDDVGLARAVQLGAIIEQPLPLRGVRPVRLAWQVHDAANVRGILVGARVTDAADGVRVNLTMGALYAGFAGLMLALFAHNLALWRVLRQRFQLYYVAMVAALLCYAFSASGAFAWVWPELGNSTRLRLNYLALGSAAVCAIGFARHFFEPRIFAGWVGRAANGVSVAVLVTGAAFATLAPWHIWWLDRLFSLAFAAIVLVVVPMLWRAWSRRSDYRWLFGIAWAAPIVLAAVRIAHGLNQVGWRFWIDNSTLVSMAGEALISSLAIAYRVRLLADERDAARAQEIAARMLADTDPLTGLMNRRAFLRQAFRPGIAQRLLLIDVDHFKRVNDTIGHDGGDDVLCRIAGLLSAATPAAGLVARLGGEEFAILAPVGAAPDAQTLLAALRALPMPFDLAVTASIGTCDGRLADERDWKALYHAADRALFEAKAAGRDRARLALAA